MEIKKGNRTKNEEVKCQVLEKCGVISEGTNGWKTELRFVSWNGNEPKYDIRPWKKKEDGTEICGKGITLWGDELEKLVEIVKGMEE